MGQLVDGVWKEGWYDADAGGGFERPPTKYRRKISADGATDGFRAEPGRYHLYASYACPWAQRALITRAVRGLDELIGVTIVDPKMSEAGWSFGGDGGEPDPLFGSTHLREIYLRANPKYSGRVTVPVLWDKETGTIVNNESREVMRMLDTAFDAFARPGTSLLPPGLEGDVDEMLDSIYPTYNNGVYRAGFATRQTAYEAACRDVFATLDRIEPVLARSRYLCGNVLTEADVAMFTTSLRFDLVYYSHFKCNVRRLQDYPAIWGWARELYQMPAIRRTCRLDQIKTHYYWSQTTVNPSRIVPLGPTIDWEAPHGRDDL